MRNFGSASFTVRGEVRAMNIMVVFNWLQAVQELRGGADLCVQDEPGVMRGLKTRVFVPAERCEEVVGRIPAHVLVWGRKQEGELTGMVGFDVFLSTQEIKEALSRETESALAEVA